MIFTIINYRFNEIDDSEQKYCDATEICCGLPDAELSSFEETKEIPECGHRNVNVIESRISGGGTAQYSKSSISGINTKIQQLIRIRIFQPNFHG